MRALRVSVTALLLASCSSLTGGDEAGGGSRHGGKADDGRSATQDIVATDLVLDVAALHGTATIEVASRGDSASFEIGDLAIESVEGPDGALDYDAQDGTLEVTLPAGRADDETIALKVDYAFSSHEQSDGYDASLGSTMLWPYFCKNLFPCDSRPAEGGRFSLALEGVPEDSVAVFPAEIPTDTPAYAFAFAMGNYVERELGRTSSGTTVSVWYFQEDEAATLEGTKHLAQAFEFFESTYGAYRFGEHVGSVEAAWRGLAAGGMEHHPYWHVARESMSDEETHAHEAAHGWFGDGVRIQCWEDFVLSEGLASYLAARAIETVGERGAGEAIWADYEERLRDAVRSGDREARPSGCNEIQILHDPLWSSVPYMKGAFFLRAVANEVGVDALDRALAKLYGEYGGRAAGVEDLLDVIRDETGFDPSELAEGWLYKLGTPD